MYTRNVKISYANNNIKNFLNFYPLCHSFDQFSGEWPNYIYTKYIPAFPHHLIYMPNLANMLSPLPFITTDTLSPLPFMTTDMLSLSMWVRHTDTYTCLLWRPPAHAQEGGWTSQCNSHLSLVVDSMSTSSWCPLSSFVHATTFTINGWNLYILNNACVCVWGGGGQKEYADDVHNKHGPDIINCYTINIHLPTWIIVQKFFSVLKHKKPNTASFLYCSILTWSKTRVKRTYSVRDNNVSQRFSPDIGIGWTAE